MHIPKTVETSLLTVNVYDFYVSVRVIKKLTQLRLFEEVIPDASKIQRSELTGELVITMRKKESDEQLRNLVNAEKEKKLREMKEHEKAEYEKKKVEEERLKALYDKAKQKMKIQELETRDCLGRKIEDDDDDDIPDLD